MLTGVVVGVVVAGLAPVWSPAVPAAVVVGFLVIARRQVSRTRAKAWERTLRTAAVSPAAPVGDEPDDAPTVVMDAVVDDEALRRQQVVAAAVVPASDGSSLWDPLPVTLPTYVVQAAGRARSARRPRRSRRLDVRPVADEERAGEPGDPACRVGGWLRGRSDGLAAGGRRLTLG